LSSWYGLDKLALKLKGVKPVCVYAGDYHRLGYATKSCSKTATTPSDIKSGHGISKYDITACVEAAREFVCVVIQIRLDREAPVGVRVFA
jgi:hypothetical protein